MTFIVLVDDDISVLRPLTEQLETEGYKVQAFQSSLDAKDFFKTQNPDLAIFDIKMPDLNGYQLLKEVRLGNPSLPIIFLSSKISIVLIIDSSGAFNLLRNSEFIIIPEPE